MITTRKEPALGRDTEAYDSGPLPLLWTLFLIAAFVYY